MCLYVQTLVPVKLHARLQLLAVSLQARVVSSFSLGHSRQQATTSGMYVFIGC